jgi:hypothetical protein
VLQRTTIGAASDRDRSCKCLRRCCKWLAGAASAYDGAASCSPELQRADVRAANVHRRSCKAVLVLLQAAPGSCKRFRLCCKRPPPELQVIPVELQVFPAVLQMAAARGTSDSDGAANGRRHSYK